MEKNISKFERLFEGIKLSLETEGEYFSKVVDHSGEKGRLNESHLKRVLSTYLPKKFALATGFAVSSETFSDQEADNGPQLDIIIYDALNNTPLYQSEAFGIFPLEMIYGYVEVKTSLDVSELDAAFLANSKLRALKDQKAYANVVMEPQLAPRFYMFCYNCKIVRDNIVKRVKEAFEKMDSAHCHGLYLLNYNLLISRQACGPGVLKLNVWDSLALPRFIAMIGEQTEGMIPTISSGEFKGMPFSFAMPRANMLSYFPKPTVVE